MPRIVRVTAPAAPPAPLGWERRECLRFVPETNTRVVAVYRPTSPPRLRAAPAGGGIELSCPAEERWVAVELAP